MTTNKTILYDEHVKNKAKIVDFHGWLMPISFDSVVEEHHTVRNKVGLFDVSHMGRVMIEGRDALAFLEKLLVNNLSKVKVSKSQYTLLCNEFGGILDDLIVYRTKENSFLLCLNASNLEKDFAWIKTQAKPYKDLNIKDLSSSTSQIALQGPFSKEVLTNLWKTHGDQKVLNNLTSLEHNQIAEVCFPHTKINLWVARTGYTGEFGYELYVPNEIAVPLWQGLLEAGKTLGIKSIGLGARDSLRLEACYNLYGNDILECHNPFEVGLDWVVKLDKPDDFLGKKELTHQKELGRTTSLVAFKMTERAVPRSQMDVLNLAGERLGAVSSGGFLPSLDAFGGLAHVKHKVNECPQVGTALEISVRGQKKRAEIVKMPFYKAKTK